MNREKREFHPWMHKISSDFASFDQRPDSIRGKAYLLNKGIRCEDWFPEDVKFQMSDETGMVLADSIPNNAILLIISEKLKAILKAEASEKIEFLPIKILDHQKNEVDSRYYIANILKIIRCMDHQKSEYVMSALDKTQVHHIEHLYLDENKIPAETNIFRLGEETSLVLVKNDFAKSIIDSGCTGISFIDIRDYGKQYRLIDRVALAKSLLENR